MRNRLAIALLVCVSACTPSAPTTPASLVLGTTTSVGNSGLLQPLVQAWRQSRGPEIKAVLAGSGRALRMLELNQADVVISHAPDAERDYLARHRRWRYRKFMFNAFAIVGPQTDAAGVRSAPSLDEAMRRMASGPLKFVSRGDESGTHERERTLWKAANVARLENVVTSGAGMAATLRQASELGAYTLTDVATFEQLEDRLSLVVLWSGDPRLLNTYGVIVNPDGPAAREALRFATWLEEGEGRRVIEAYRIAGSNRPPFQIWPAGAPRDNPAATPR